MADAQNLFQDWYDQYVLPRKAPMEGVFSKDKPDFSLGIPTAPRVATAAPAQVPAVSQAPTPTAPENPLVDYTTQPQPEPVATGPSWLDKISTGMRESKGMSPGAMGILGMGLSMAATPPRAVPYSGAEIIGRSGLAGLGIYEKALEDKRKQQALDVSAEEHRLTREDRALSAREKADYYKQRLLDYDEQMKITAKKNADDIEIKKRSETPIGPNDYGIDPTTPMWKVKDTIGLQKQVNTPEKPEKKDPFNAWVDSLGRAPTTEEIERWHKAQSAGGGEDGPGKAAAITHINKELVSQYTDKARANITAKLPAGSAELKATMDAFNSQDPLSGGLNEGRVREALSTEQRKEYDFVKVQAQKYSTKMVPAEAVTKAQADWNEKNPPKKEAGGAGYDEFKKVYQSILDYKGWDNKTKNEKIKALNDAARAKGYIK